MCALVALLSRLESKFPECKLFVVWPKAAVKFKEVSTILLLSCSDVVAMFEVHPESRKLLGLGKIM